MEILNVNSGKRSYFTREQKLQIIQEHRDKGIPISQLARQNGIHPITIYQWKRLMNESDDQLDPAKIKELLLENQRLKQENKALKVKVGDLAVTNDVLNDALDIAKKRALLKQAQLQEQSKKQKSIKPAK